MSTFGCKQNSWGAQVGLTTLFLLQPFQKSTTSVIRLWAHLLSKGLWCDTHPLSYALSCLNLKHIPRDDAVFLSCFSFPICELLCSENNFLKYVLRQLEAAGVLPRGISLSVTVVKGGSGSGVGVVSEVRPELPSPWPELMGKGPVPGPLSSWDGGLARVQEGHQHTSALPGHPIWLSSLRKERTFMHPEKRTSCSASLPSDTCSVFLHGGPQTPDGLTGNPDPIARWLWHLSGQLSTCHTFSSVWSCQCSVTQEGTLTLEQRLQLQEKALPSSLWSFIRAQPTPTAGRTPCTLNWVPDAVFGNCVVDSTSFHKMNVCLSNDSYKDRKTHNCDSYIKNLNFQWKESSPRHKGFGNWDSPSHFLRGHHWSSRPDDSLGQVLLLPPNSLHTGCWLISAEYTPGPVARQLPSPQGPRRPLRHRPRLWQGPQQSRMVPAHLLTPSAHTGCLGFHTCPSWVRSAPPRSAPLSWSTLLQRTFAITTPCQSTFSQQHRVSDLGGPDCTSHSPPGVAQFRPLVPSHLTVSSTRAGPVSFCPRLPPKPPLPFLSPDSS